MTYTAVLFFLLLQDEKFRENFLKRVSHFDITFKNSAFYKKAVLISKKPSRSCFFLFSFEAAICIVRRALPRLVHFHRRSKFRKPNYAHGLESFSLKHSLPLETWSFSFSPHVEQLA